MDTSEPSPGTPEEQSDGNPDYEPDFTIATSPETGLIIAGQSGSEAILGRKIPGEMRHHHSRRLLKGNFPRRGWRPWPEAILWSVWNSWQFNLPDGDLRKKSRSDRGCLWSGRKFVLLRFPIVNDSSLRRTLWKQHGHDRPDDSKGSNPDRIWKLRKTNAAIRVPQSVDRPQEPTGWIGSNSLIALKFHRIRYRLRKPSGKGGNLDRGPLPEGKQFSDRNGPPRQD